jgi:protein-disulfide isomerase
VSRRKRAISCQRGGPDPAPSNGEEASLSRGHWFAGAGLFIVVLVGLILVALPTSRGGGSPSHEDIEKRVDALLEGIPQNGSTLGDPSAPVTLRMFADLECLSVKHLVTSYLPWIIRDWVRPGLVKIEYRSLETDTREPRRFMQQETAALAAGRQNKMWNFVETFVYEQGTEYTPYATEGFIEGIAAQVPGLDRAAWRHDGGNVSLSDRVLEGQQLAAAEGLRATPSFLIGRTGGRITKPIGTNTGFGTLIDAAALRRDVGALRSFVE